MERLGTAAMGAQRIAQARVCHKEASYNEGHTEYTKQNWSPDRTPARLKDLPEPNSKAEYEQPADKEVSNLHPSLITKTQTAPIVVPCAVARTSGTLDQKYNHKEQGSNCTARDQESGHHALFHLMIFLCLHNRFLLFHH